MDRCCKISRVIHVCLKSGLIGDNPGCCSLLLEIKIDQLLRETFQLLQISGLMHCSLEPLLFKQLMEGNFHPSDGQLNEL